MSLAALHRRNLLKEIDLTPDEFRALLDLAAELKAAKRRAARSDAWPAGTSR